MKVVKRHINEEEDEEEEEEEEDEEERGGGGGGDREGGEKRKTEEKKQDGRGEEAEEEEDEENKCFTWRAQKLYDSVINLGKHFTHTVLLTHAVRSRTRRSWLPFWFGN